MTKKPKKPPSDRLLAAPPETLNSPSERLKYQQRRAREDAEAKRLRATKATEKPTIEDMLADIIRVAEDEDTNPFWQHKSISRRRYEMYGHYPVEFIDKQFGQFEHAKQVAGLADAPGTRMWRTARAERSRREHAARYIKRHILPYVAGAKLQQPLSNSYLLLSISDTHTTFLDPFTWQCFLSAIRDLRPDGVLLNGDIIEGAEISRYPKIPGWTVPLQLELDFKREMFRQIREDAGHDGDLFDTAGNHDTDRLAMYLTQVAPALSGLRTLRIDKLMGLEEYGVKLFHGGTIASPEGTEDAKAGFLLFGFYRIHHGTRLGPTPAVGELRDAGRSGQSGHVHRASIAFGTTEKDAGLSWMCTPCGCTEFAARSYIKGVTSGWQRGFGLARLFPGGQVRQYPVITDGGVCHIEGYEYNDGGIPQQDPQKLWLPDLRLHA